MVQIRKLSNGIPVIYERVSNLRSVSVGICVKAGSRNEKQGESGIFHFLEHMIFKGTKRRSSKDISELIDGIGGELNAFTSRETTVFYATVLDKNVDIAIDLLGDMVTNSTIANEEVEKERNVILEEIKMYEDMPEDMVHENNIGNALKNTKLSRPVAGNEESVKNISTELLKSCFNKYYNQENIFVSVVGNFDIEKVENLLNQALASMKGKDITNEDMGEFKINNENVKLSKDTNQVHLCINTKGLSHPSEDIFKLYIVSNALGGGSSSRLFQSIREDRGLAYSVYSYLSCYKDGGLFTTYAGTSKESYKEVLELTHKEYEKLAKEGITEKELEKAKNQIISSIVLDLEGSKSQMFRNMNLFFSTGEVKSFQQIVKQIRRVTLSDIKEFCDEHFNEKYYSYTALGDI